MIIHPHKSCFDTIHPSQHLSEADLPAQVWPPLVKEGAANMPTIPSNTIYHSQLITPTFDHTLAVCSTCSSGGASYIQVFLSAKAWSSDCSTHGRRQQETHSWPPSPPHTHSTTTWTPPTSCQLTTTSEIRCLPPVYLELRRYVCSVWDHPHHPTPGSSSQTSIRSKWNTSKSGIIQEVQEAYGFSF